MTTSEIERLLTATLHAHAEDAMTRTDTQTQLETLHRDAASRHPRAGSAAVGLVAAAAVVAAAVWWQGTRDDTVIEPAPPVDVPTQAEQLATDFVEAWADFDRARLASYIADGATLTLGPVPGNPDGWRLENRFDQAAGFGMQLQLCSENFSPGDRIQVGCAFRLQMLRSDQLGRGPYDNSIFNVTVENGKVVDASLYFSGEDSGYDDQMLHPFEAWMDEQHPEDAEVMDAFWDPASTKAEINASLQLWEQRTHDYVDAVRAGDAE
jgi:hypothetical protein